MFILPFFNFSEKDGSPGTGGNPIASIIAINAGRTITHLNIIGAPILEHTRIIILSTDGEEAGLRGAAAFVQEHMNNLHSLPTYVFNIDSIYSVDDIHFLTSNINGTVQLSKDMASQCNQIAQNLGYDSKTIPIPPGAGGTDAGEFGRVGIEATTIIAMPTEIIRDDLVYHTINDTVENIDPLAVEAVIKVLFTYLLEKEQEVSLLTNQSNQTNQTNQT
ncbi:MAG: M28 family peptidase [Promethearchaeota archaeon]